MKFLKLDKRALSPTQSYDGAVGYDFYSIEEVVLPAFDPLALNESILVDDFLKLERYEKYTRKIKTGIAVELTVSHAGLFRDRSSYGSGGIIVTAGVIDPDYRGEVIICLLNLNDYTVIIPAGSKVAQMLVLPAATTPPQEVMSLSQTARGSNGFGSTGS